MKNDTCFVCGEKFEPRKNKMYCPDSCKQIAYNNRKQSLKMASILKCFRLLAKV